MNRITDLSIKGFRGIRSLHLGELGRINILLGKNNCGKSSVLEAVTILLGAEEPRLLTAMNLKRKYKLLGRNTLSLFFHNLNVSSDIAVTAMFENTNERSLRVSYHETGNVSEVPLKELQEKKLSTDRELKCGLTFKYRDGGNDDFSRIELNEIKSSYSVVSTETFEIKYKGKYMPPGYDFDDSISSFDKIITKKEKKKVLGVLRHIESRINDVAVVNNVIMVDVGLEKMIPINVLGDGVRKLFAIIVAMYDVEGGYLMIDEIDNGLYYKAQKTLWNAMLKASDDLDVQIFVSTHSLDSLNALTSVLTDELPSFKDEVKVYTLRKEESDDISEYPYSYEMFNHLLNQEVEIR